jgi:hypothetical protein
MTDFPKRRGRPPKVVATPMPDTSVGAQDRPPKIRKRFRQMISGMAPYVAPKGVVQHTPTFGHRPRPPTVRLTLQPNRI